MTRGAKGDPLCRFGRVRDQLVIGAQEAIDVTLPARIPPRGSLHPVTETTEAIVDVLVGLGYQVLDSPEVETDWHTFTALNTPPDHPSKSLSDTIYVRPLTPDARPTPDGTTGILVPPADEAALSDAMVRLAGDRELRGRLGRAGPASVHAKFGLERMFDETLAVYAQVVEGSPG